MSVTPYGKDKTPDWLGMTFMRLAGVRFGRGCACLLGFLPIFLKRRRQPCQTSGQIRKRGVTGDSDDERKMER